MVDYLGRMDEAGRLSVVQGVSSRSNSAEKKPQAVIGRGFKMGG